MFISINTPAEDFNNISNGEPLKISKDIALDREYLDFLFTNFPDSSTTILSGYTDVYSSFSTLYNEEETIILANNVDYVFEKYGKFLTFDENYTVDEAISASRQINEIVDEINNSKINNQPLSPFEKFAFAYRFVTDRIYKPENKNDDLSVSRSPISVLNGDKIVCTGFANLLAIILNKLGIPCTEQCIIIYDHTSKEYGNHATCLVRLVDPKYNIDGIYYSDPTADSAVKSGITTFNASLVQLSNVENVYGEKIVLNKGVSKHGIKTFANANKFSNNIPPILANLFPEKTNGKNQSTLIRELADKKMAEAGIYESAEQIINNITMREIQNTTTSIAENILDYSKFCFVPENLNDYLNNVVESLHFIGLKNEEIANLLDTHYSAETVKQLFHTFYKNKYFNVKSKQLQQKMEHDIQLTNQHLLTVKNNLLKTNTNTSNNLSFESNCFEHILKQLTSSLINKKFFGSKTIDKSFVGTINYLLLKGYSLNDIKSILCGQLLSFSAGEIYFEECDEEQELYVYSQLNEQEIYANNHIDPNHIYNIPYMKDYNQLTQQARFIERKDFLAAFTTIFTSHGYDEKKAQKFAKSIIKNSTIEKPKQKH